MSPQNMSRRRKRKKERASEEGAEQKREPLTESSFPAPETLPDLSPESSEAPEEPPAPETAIPAATETAQTLLDELDLELSDDFGDDPRTISEAKPTLPSGDSKVSMREMRKPVEEQEDEARTRVKASEETPSKHQRMRKSADLTIDAPDALGDLEDDPLEREPIPEKEGAPVVSQESAQESALPPVDEPPAPAATIPQKNDSEAEPKPQTPLLQRVKDTLGSLSMLEQASLGLLFVTLIAGAIWSSSVVAARIPNTVIASKLKYPLRGESVIIANLESYWRSPIREGDQADEGVSQSIEIIPEIRITVAPDSKAKSLRFLFRDEEGDFVGDSSTVRLSGGKFLPATDVTTTTNGNVATIHSTTGFQHEGELISYLADDKFQWEFVILESKDGREYREFMAIPISARRNDSQ